MSTLMLHTGAFSSTYEEVTSFEAPPETESYQPISHKKAIDGMLNKLVDLGFGVKRERYGITKAGDRFFGVVDLNDSALDGMGYSVGIRNSYDKSMKLSYCAGTRIFVCDNGVFSGDLFQSTRHTHHVDFDTFIADCAYQMPASLQALQENIEKMKSTHIDDDAVREILINSAKAQVIRSGDILGVWDEFKSPRHQDFAGDLLTTEFNLLMAFTEQIKLRNSIIKTEQAYRNLSQFFSL